MKLSVIILNYNVRYFLEQSIESVIRATKKISTEIIIIDNASTDDSCAMVKQKYPRLTLIENSENVGFSRANNQAVAMAQGEYLCILNPDTAVAEDTFISLLRFADSIEKLGAVGIYLMDGTGNFLPESKRKLPTPYVSLLKMIGRTKKYYAQKIGETETAPVQILVGAFMLIKREIYNEVAGFDEDYFMYGEDIDLSYKIEKAGYNNYYFGSVKTLHYKGESTTKDSVYIKRFYGAMKIFYRKHFSYNFVFNLVVNVGVSAARVINFRKIQVNISSENPTKKPAFLLTESFGLYKTIRESLDFEIKAVSKSIFQDSIPRNTYFIFDADYMPYWQIFSIMDKLQNKGNTFRIKPPNCNFILGSDLSDQKGTVFVF